MFSEIIVSQQEPINRPCAFVGKPKIPSDVATKLCTRRGFGSKQSTRQFLRVFQNTETEPIQHSICRHMALCFAGGEAHSPSKREEISRCEACNRFHLDDDIMKKRDIAQDHEAIIKLIPSSMDKRNTSLSTGFAVTRTHP